MGGLIFEGHFPPRSHSATPPRHLAHGGVPPVTMKMRRYALFETITVAIIILAGSTVIYRTFPEATKDGVWTHNVLRNWEDYGVFNLRGQLVCNPGGRDVVEEPKIYSGHRAGCLYPSYLVGHFSGGAGQSGLAFHLALTAAATAAIWLILGTSRFALLAASAVAFSPGYLRHTTLLDPIAIPVMLALPAAYWICQQFESDNLSWRSRGALICV